MHISEVLNRLDDAGVRLRVKDETLIAGPREAMTDVVRETIRAHRVDLLAAVSTTFDTAAGFEEALQLGRLVICIRCEHFAARPARQPDGWCYATAEATWARAPFQCPTYRPSRPSASAVSIHSGSLK